MVADFKQKLRRDEERDMALAPIKAEIAARKKAEAEIKAAKDSVEKTARQQKASSASNIVKELRANFGDNRQEEDRWCIAKHAWLE